MSSCMLFSLGVIFWTFSSDLSLQRVPRILIRIMNEEYVFRIEIILRASILVARAYARISDREYSKLLEDL